MPRKEFAAFTRLDASDVNTYLMDQAVQTFAGTAARGSAITEPVEGMVTYLEDLDRYDTYNGSSHVPMGGLTLVKAQTIGSAVSSVVVTDAFSADYDDYKITVSGGESASAGTFSLQLGSSTASYSFVRRNINFATSAEVLNTGSNTTVFGSAGSIGPNLMHLGLELLAPFLSRNTTVVGASASLANGGTYAGIHAVADSFTGFTLSSTQPVTGGTINIYGFKKA
jgi:hypothetical protein